MDNSFKYFGKDVGNRTRSAIAPDSDSILKAGTRAVWFQFVGKFGNDDVALKFN